MTTRAPRPGRPRAAAVLLLAFAAPACPGFAQEVGADTPQRSGSPLPPAPPEVLPLPDEVVILPAAEQGVVRGAITPGVLSEPPRGPDGRPIVLQPEDVLPVPPLVPPPGAGLVPPDDPTVPREQRDTLYIDRASEAEFQGDTVILTGDVQLRYNGYRITCDRATYNPETRVATFESRGRLYTARQVVDFDVLRLNLRTREFDTTNGRTIIPPDLTGSNLLEPLRIDGRNLRRVGTDLIAEDGFLTTCEFPFPHYRIGFKRAQVIPNRRIIIREATLYQYDKRILTIPYLVIPIREQIRYSYLPLFGRTVEEGYFVKSVLGYSLGDQYPGLLRIDAMEKKGIGLGTDQAYRVGAAAAGTFALYTLNDQSRDVQNLNGRIYHQQRLGDVNATLSSDFQNNSYYAVASDSRSRSTTLTANRNVGGGSTAFTFTNTGSSQTTSNSQGNSFSITQQQRFGRNLNANFRFNSQDQSNSYQTTTTGADGNPVAATSRSGRQEQNGEVRATGRIGAFDLSLNANRTFLSRQITPTGTSSGFTGTERLPEISLSTDAQRLGGFLTGLPLRFNLGLGRFVENQSQGGSVTTSRALFDLDATPRTLDIGGRRTGLTLNWNGGFSQYLYDARDAAQYVLQNRAVLQKRIGGYQAFSLTYDYLRPYGGAPVYQIDGDSDGTLDRLFTFRLDSVGSTNRTSANYTINSPRVRLNLQTTYDIRQAREPVAEGIERRPWSPLSLGLSLRPSGGLQTRFSSSYDINTGRLIDLQNQVRIRGRGGFALDTGVRFDPIQKRFPQIAGALESPFRLARGDYYLSAFARYNQVTSRWEYRRFALTRILHDYEITLGYVDQPFGGFRQEKGVQFSIRLKAFPAGVSNVGGQYGTSLDVGTGEIF